MLDVGCHCSGMSWMQDVMWDAGMCGADIVNLARQNSKELKFFL